MSILRKSKNVRLTEQDYAIIARLQQHYGIASQNEVIRMALRSAERELSQQGLSNMLPNPIARSQGDAAG